jgi:hypothetical protein
MISIFRKIKKILLVILPFSKLNLSFRFVADSAESASDFLHQSTDNKLKPERVEVRPQTVRKAIDKNVIYKKILSQKNKDIIRPLVISNSTYFSIDKKNIPVEVYVKSARRDYVVDNDLLNDSFFSDKLIESDSLNFLLEHTKFNRLCRSEID